MALPWLMICPSCETTNTDEAEACFTCGKALHALTQGTVLAGRYEIQRPLGRGGMGRVYKAHDRILDEDVAVKVLRTELLRDPVIAQRFRSEIKLARKVTHRNVCRIHEYGEDGDLRFICMEYVDGVNLKEFLGGRPLSWPEAYELAAQVAAGLQAVHEHGIVHRDFKATNIMVDRRGLARLMDFGIAKDIEADTSGMSAAGSVVGTPEYMSPEQAQGARVDFRSDIYALGCVLYEIFTGRAPFHGATPLLTLFMHLHEQPPLGEEEEAALPPSLVPLLRVALAKEAEDRFGSVAELAHALEASRVAEGCRAGTTLPLRPPPRAPVDDDVRPPDTFTLPTPARRRAPVGVNPTGALGEDARASPMHPRWRGWRPAAWALGAIVAAVAALLAGSRGQRFGEAPPVSPFPAPSIAVATIPPAVTSAATPAAPASLAVERPTLPRRAVASPPPWTIIASRPLGSPPPPAATPIGTLQLVIMPPAEVTVDGSSLGTVSRREIALPPGSHAVRVLHPDYQPLNRKVPIQAGQTYPLVLDLAEKGIPKRR